MTNKVETPQTLRKLQKVSDIAGGTLVRYYYQTSDLPPMLFVVSAKKHEVIGALSIENGNYLTPDARVEVVPSGEIITVTAGGGGRE